MKLFVFTEVATPRLKDPSVVHKRFSNVREF